MLDIIQIALNKIGIPTPDNVETVNTITNSLPVEKDPVLIKKQVEGEAFRRQAEIGSLALVAKEMAINIARSKVNSVVGSNLGSVKLPVVDQKQLSVVSIQNKINEIANERIRFSKESITKASELYTYQLPKVSDNQRIDDTQMEDFPLV